MHITITEYDDAGNVVAVTTEAAIEVPANLTAEAFAAFFDQLTAADASNQAEADAIGGTQLQR